MKEENIFDSIIVGGSYSGLAAGMALGRALNKVLIIDSGKPCNAQTPHSHNFLTQDGQAPEQMAMLAKQQVQQYDTVTFFDGLATRGRKSGNGFEIQVASGETFWADKLIFATGIRDILPAIGGLAECWGISALHCPYCHGYERKGEKTGVLGNGEHGFELAQLISNWTNDLTLFTNGASTLTTDQQKKLEKNHIQIEEKEIGRLGHTNGQLHQIAFKDGTPSPISALYVRSLFEQHCKIPETLGCELTDEGYIKTDAFQETTVSGIYACGDNSTRMRTVANAVAMGTATGMTISKRTILKHF
jgi:thioredoxin reductase